ncbi:hypothetical protein HYV89_00020 [Candidatus Woesearchaeota archaeon]|nr:hypothetical protein [Candidatus Woesearchaeota archaeon]
MKNNKIKAGIVVLFFIILLYKASAFNGTGSAGEEVRFGMGYFTVNSTDGAAKIHGFGNKIAHIIRDDSNFKGWLSQLEYNFFAPEQVDLNFPLNNSYYNFTPDFDWSNTTDTEQFEVSYLFEIWNESSASNIHFVNYSIAETANTTKTIPTINGEGIFYWRVAANDSSKNSSFSNLNVITIDTTLPTAFNITSPADASSSTDTTPALQWDSSTDTNLDNYTIEISTSVDFSAVNQTEVSETNSLANWSSPLTAGTYYWRVSAVDNANNQRLSGNNLSFIVQASETTTVTVSTSEASSGGGTKPFTLNILAPEGIILSANDQIKVPLLVINPSSVNIRGINLALQSDETKLSLSLDRAYISELAPGDQEKLTLTINTGDLSIGSYGITIFASVVSPTFSDSTRIFANLLERTEGEAEVLEQIEFAKQLFQGNPECLDLSEYITEAEAALQNKNSATALSLAENAVEACNKLIAQRSEFKSITAAATLVDKVKRQFSSKTSIIVASEILGMLTIAVAVYKYRKFRIKKRRRH